ncbi:MAG TPA: SHD1 domain-containing protein [Pirellulales bacterium]|nr:SHD1 domain-containing protein [Pirellulales bacterium]
MKKFLLSCSTLALLTFGAPWANAQDDSSETRPVVLASFSGYAELKRDLEYLGALSGNLDMAAGLEQLLLPFTQGHVLTGLDPARPWGASLRVADDGSRYSVVAFLPVDDLGKLLDALAASIEVDGVGDGIYEIKRNANTFFITQQGKWAYVARHKSNLENLPVDPLEQLRGLDQQYDLALRVNVQNIPQGLRDMAAGLIKLGLDGRLQHELDRLTVGLNIDRSTGRTYLDLEVTALPDSDAAKRLAAGSEQPADSRLAGVLMPDAIFSLHLNSPLSSSEEVDEQGATWLNSLRGQVLAKIDNEEDINDERKAKVKEWAGKLLDLLDKAIEKEGRINFGLVVTAGSKDEFADIINDAIENAFPNRVHETIIGAGQVTVVAGGLTADGAEWEAAVMQIVAMVAEGAGQDQPKLNVDNYKGRRFHAFSVMAPQTMRAELPLRTLRNVLGNPLKIVLAFGDDTFYAAVGEKGADAIKRVIDKSAETPAEKLPPVTASLALAPVWKFIASQNHDPTAATIAESLQQAGKDHVKLTVEPIAGGVRYRLESEEAVNKLLGFSLGRAAGMIVSRLDEPVATVPAPNRAATNTQDGDATTSTTTTQDDGATTTTTTRTETRGEGGRTSQREVTITRRGSSGRPPSGPNGGKQPRPVNKTAGGDKKEDAKPETTMRTWSSKSGKFKVQAKFVEMQDESVKLEDEDGDKVTIAIDKLSEADQKLARQLAQAMEVEDD